ncbi:soluble pyridine nucleotide transhydrogenase [Citrobacter koseri]|uniref:Soluble pyridine nucleotide transhydrogenase n=1 Tax=Citrobacter koseri TaxID=545 RepID=A0A3S5DP07_CITKO|nr:soluble pyridine nucleotide transhydrogenase [Citrobacter koseri]
MRQSSGEWTSKVDLINTRDRLLAFLDQEMSDSLSYHFWNSGVVIRHNEEYEKIEGCDDGVIMHLKSGKKLKADWSAVRQRTHR